MVDTTDIETNKEYKRASSDQRQIKICTSDSSESSHTITTRKTSGTIHLILAIRRETGRRKSLATTGL